MGLSGYFNFKLNTATMRQFGK